MKFNGFITAGMIATAVGWLRLGVGATVGVGRFGLEQVYNVHLGTMAQMCIQFGYTMLIVGTVVSGIRWLKPEPDSKTSEENTPR